ncbi:MAG: hypothetical protein JRJ85_16575 [Deltaproteobacteria bacterium]|nr:hypothetical protein [Deltaproteobacteria bacterium]
MTILDQKFKEFEDLPSEEKIMYFERDGRLYDMIISQQLNRQILDHIHQITNQLRHIAKSKTGSLFLQSLLFHKRAMLYFAQPSGGMAPEQFHQSPGARDQRGFGKRPASHTGHP